MNETPLYSNLLLYYFTGTGNARMSAKWIAEAAEKENINVRVISIDRFKNIEIPALEGKTLIGFCYPTHGFNAPPIILKFIWKFPSVKNANVFFLNTRAGMKLHKFFLPGVSGIAQLLPLIMLRLKGYRIKSMFSVDLPSNWISIHPGLKKKVVDSMFVKYHNKVTNFANKILHGKGIYNDLYDLPVDLALAPIALGYYLVGRFALSKTFFASDACTDCGLCEKNCPTESIKKVNDRPFWTYTCESCMRCMNTCPQRAIHTPHLFTVLVWYFCFTTLFPFIKHDLSAEQLLHLKLNFGLAHVWRFITVNGAGLTFVFITYYILHFLLRYKYINKFITYTSLTHFRFWRRYKAS